MSSPDNASRTPPPSPPGPHPRAVLLARAFLAVLGALALVPGLVMLFGAAGAHPGWLAAAAIGLGIALLLAAFLERPAGVVATFLLFFFPWT